MEFRRMAGTFLTTERRDSVTPATNKGSFFGLKRDRNGNVGNSSINGHAVASSGTGTSEPDNQPGKIREQSDNATKTRSSGRSSIFQTAVGTENESIFNIESNDVEETEKPKRKPYTKRASKSNNELRTEPFSPKMVEDFTVQTFRTIASLKKAEYWAIQDSEKEVRTWAGHAAHLANHLPMSNLTGASLIASAFIVATGIGALAIPRMATDAVMKSPMAQAVAEQQELKRNQRMREYEQTVNTSEPDDTIEPMEYVAPSNVRSGSLNGLVRDGMGA